MRNGPARSLPSTRRPKQSSASKECATSRTTTRGRASKTSIRLFCNPRWNRPGQYPAAPERKCEVGYDFCVYFDSSDLRPTSPKIPLESEDFTVPNRESFIMHGSHNESACLNNHFRPASKENTWMCSVAMPKQMKITSGTISFQCNMVLYACMKVLRQGLFPLLCSEEERLHE